MCGIIGGVASIQIQDILIEGLQRLEYRGYDSAGMALLGSNNQTKLVKAKGKVDSLKKKLDKDFSIASTGIAHTRWATHGKPCEKNAHPHQVGNRISLVHNGIVENYQELKEAIVKKQPQTQFISETDSEVVAWYIYYALQNTNKNLCHVVQETSKDFEGSFALAILDNESPHQLVALRKGSPLVVAKGNTGIFVTSDPIAIVEYANSIGILDEGDSICITGKDYQVYDNKAKAKKKQFSKVDYDITSTSKNEYRHFMEKEIHEQPEKIYKTLQTYANESEQEIHLHNQDLDKLLDRIESIHCVACGTSYHAASVARYWIEQLSGINCQVEVASEYRHRSVATHKKTLFLALSQSGETADTIAALHKAKESGSYEASLVICNSPQSSIVRDSDYSLITRAGIEVSVASTKAFTTQLTLLFLLALRLANKITKKEKRRLLKELYKLPESIKNVIDSAQQIEAFSSELINKYHALYIGRGTMFPLAQEGALKLKEISYMYAEAYPAGELKHGPLALIDKETPVIVVSPPTSLLKKLHSNLEEVQARGGIMLIFLDEKQKIKKRDFDKIITIPHIDPLLAPILYIIPLQLLAYQVAVLKGTDLDQPRNLAKSVTVE